MGKRKNVSEPVRKLGRRDKEMLNSNLNLSLSPQPMVHVTKLNIPKLFKNSKKDNMTVNVTSKHFEKLLMGLNTHKKKQQPVKNVKPMKNFKRNKGQPCVKSTSDPSPKNKTKKNHFPPTNKNDSNLHIEENNIEPLPSKIDSEDPNPIENEENQCSDTRVFAVQEVVFESKDLDTQNEDIPAESITRTDKVIDTFLDVLRKTTDDDSILSALQRDYICDLCQRGFLSKGSLRKHVLICGLGVKPKKKNNKKKKKGNHLCLMCGIIYVNKESLDKHNANVHNLKKMYKCLVCSQHFYNEEALSLHCRSRHGLGGSNIYKCPYCEASFNLRGDLNYHCRKAHNTTEYYICSKCLECFKKEDTCKLHEQSHGYCCDICMFNTKNESEMIAHRSTHLYMVVHKCGTCSRTFKTKRDFTKHIKVHEREKKL